MMSPNRKRFVVSLAENEQGKTLLNQRKQIAFCLIPTELEEGHELFKTVPVIWAMYDCHPKTFECGSTIGVATVKKKSDGSVIPSERRVVPVGYYTELTSRSTWSDVTRLREDMPATIIINNDSGVKRDLAICETYFVASACTRNWTKYNISEIPVRAYCGTGLKEMQKVRRDVEQVKDEFGNPWSVSLDDLPAVTSFQVSRLSSGETFIAVEDHSVIRSNNQMIDEIAQLKATLQVFQNQVTRALGNDLLGVQRLTAELHGTNGKVDKIEETVETRVASIESTVSSVRRALGETEDEVRQISQSVNDFATTLQDKANVGDLNTLQTEIEHDAVKVQQIEGHVVAIHNKLGAMGAQIERAEESARAVADTVRGLAEKTQGMASNHSRIERTVARMTQRVMQCETTLLEIGPSTWTVVATASNAAEDTELLEDLQHKLGRLRDLESFEAAALKSDDAVARASRAAAHFENLEAALDLAQYTISVQYLHIAL
ncbi:hypothetical protein EUX98_g6700 [Antrodiella citrinella]|uniref:Uncharacterized protein n=1 Tax=Antrodiella citrinella TaxID=2447956 RepID=A0A4S4MP49_9APHY|nr:hypothetical protein EUX98_g6700 [Antrodiella citrinella]